MILNHAITDAQSVASKWIPRELKNYLYVQECIDDENSEADDAQQSDLLENDEFSGGEVDDTVQIQTKSFFNKKSNFS